MTLFLLQNSFHYTILGPFDDPKKPLDLCFKQKKEVPPLFMIFCKDCLGSIGQPEQVHARDNFRTRLDWSTSQLGQEMVLGQRRHVGHRPLGDKSISSGEQLGKPKQSKVIGNLGQDPAQNQANKSARLIATE